VGGSAFRRLDGATQALAVGGEVVLTLGGLRANDYDRQLPLVIKSGDVGFDPIVVPGVGCLCIDAVPSEFFGPGTVGTGLIGCAPFGPAGVGLDYRAARDCRSGGGTGSGFDGAGPQGSVRLAINLAIDVLADGGSCAGNDADAYGPDGIACTADDPQRSAAFEHSFTTGTVRGEAYGDPAGRCGQDVFGHTACAVELSGHPSDCAAIAATPAGGLDGTVLAAGIPLPGPPCGDVLGLRLEALPEGECAGDCDGDGIVVITELICGVSSALGAACACPGLDRNASGRVEIDESVSALSFALARCPAEPATCPLPNPVGCRVTGCPMGEVCDASVGCAPSSCACDAPTGGWTCTKDCAGGACVTPTPGPTPTPMFVRPRGDLGYKGVRGVVFDATLGSTAPIAGASVHYSHSSLVRPGSAGDVLSDAEGRFKICLFLHDTDTIILTASASRFETATQRYGGYFLYSTGPVEIGLSPDPEPDPG
jgi:hypothetical protein